MQHNMVCVARAQSICCHAVCVSSTAAALAFKRSDVHSGTKRINTSVWTLVLGSDGMCQLDVGPLQVGAICRNTAQAGIV